MEGGSTVLERMAACLPCASWPCAGGSGGRQWQLWPGDFDDDAQPILTAPTPALAECLIPPSVSSLYEDRGQSSPESGVPSWDIGAGRPPAHQMSGHRGRSGTALSPKGQGARGADSLDRSSGQQGGIELKQAAANPLLGQFHLQDGGRFVKAKLPSASVGRQSGRHAECSDSGGVSGQGTGAVSTSMVDGDWGNAGEVLANGNANGSEQTRSQGGSPQRHRTQEQEEELRQMQEGEQELLGPPAA